jgi:hypothetical protein
MSQSRLNPSPFSDLRLTGTMIRTMREPYTNAAILVSMRHGEPGARFERIKRVRKGWDMARHSGDGSLRSGCTRTQAWPLDLGRAVFLAPLQGLGFAPSPKHPAHRFRKLYPYFLAITVDASPLLLIKHTPVFSVSLRVLE